MHSAKIVHKVIVTLPILGDDSGGGGGGERDIFVYRLDAPPLTRSSLLEHGPQTYRWYAVRLRDLSLTATTSDADLAGLPAIPHFKHGSAYRSLCVDRGVYLEDAIIGAIERLKNVEQGRFRVNA